MGLEFGDGRDWFFRKRFGLFVHWGLYAIPAWHEQIQWRGGIERKEYGKLIRRFNPRRFDPDAWLDLAQEAGMEFLCFTTKHHDGFCLWDTDQTDFNVMNAPLGKDVLGTLAEACRRRGFPLCLYYSIVDWHHRNYPTRGLDHELPAPVAGDEPDLGRYLAFLTEQVRELCTRYGEIHGFWWDCNRTDHVDPSVNAMIRSLQPKAVINNRGFDEGDFSTPERDYGDAVKEGKTADDFRAFDVRIQACQSVGSESWGYKKDEDYYTDRHLMRSIGAILAKGGGYVLNVGPRADGTIPARDAQLLRRIGKWYRVVREAFDGAEPASGMTDNRDVLLTRKGNDLYVHLFRDPTTEQILLKPIDTVPRKATLLNTGKPVEARVDLVPTRWEEKKACLRLRRLPVNRLANTVLVIKLEFDALPASIQRPEEMTS